MEERPVSLAKIQEKFIRKITIYSDHEEEHKVEELKSGFEQFMHINENDYLNEFNNDN